MEAPQANLKRSQLLAKLARRNRNRSPSDIAIVDLGTIEVDLDQILSVESNSNLFLKKPITGESVTVNQKIPTDLLDATKPTLNLGVQPEIPEISISLLEPVLPDKTRQFKRSNLNTALTNTKNQEETQKLPRPKIPKKEPLVFESTIDASGRLQLPPQSLFDKRVRPNRSVKVTIEFME